MDMLRSEVWDRGSNFTEDEDEFVEDGQRLPPKPKVERTKGVRISEADLTPAERAYADAVFPHRKKKLEGDMKYGQARVGNREPDV